MPGLRVRYDKASGWLSNQRLGKHDEVPIRTYADGINACLWAHPCTILLSEHSGLLGSWQGINHFAWV
jgi:hypothetical protein